VTPGRFGRAVLYGITPTDGVSMTIAALVMAAVAAAGSVLPVLRATRTDPGSVLRE
jgi:hypothetical protein